LTAFPRAGEQLAQKIESQKEDGQVLITGNDPWAASLSALPPDSRLNKALREIGVNDPKKQKAESENSLAAPAPEGDVTGVIIQPQSQNLRETECVNPQACNIPLSST